MRKICSTIKKVCKVASRGKLDLTWMLSLSLKSSWILRASKSRSLRRSRQCRVPLRTSFHFALDEQPDYYCYYHHRLSARGMQVAVFVSSECPVPSFTMFALIYDPYVHQQPLSSPSLVLVVPSSRASPFSYISADREWLHEVSPVPFVGSSLDVVFPSPQVHSFQ